MTTGIPHSLRPFPWAILQGVLFGLLPHFEINDHLLAATRNGKIPRILEHEAVRMLNILSKRSTVSL
jgi:hypothetical protein